DISQCQKAQKQKQPNRANNKRRRQAILSQIVTNFVAPLAPFRPSVSASRRLGERVFTDANRDPQGRIFKKLTETCKQLI
ncbi:hypothetical protein, partial [Paracoccus halophilus]|uniref:hypothetical protein n=1 Tax=Paracoccus halophilus TaxID=376733 RepID=UPI001C31A1B6